MRRALAVSAVVLTMGMTMSGAGQLGGVVDATKQAGQATKEAVKTTGEQAKKGAKATKKAVTGEAHRKCADGTVQAGKTEKAAAAACKHHGGVHK